jgi:hypothetical protein
MWQSFPTSKLSGQSSEPDLNKVEFLTGRLHRLTRKIRLGWKCLLTYWLKKAIITIQRNFIALATGDEIAQNAKLALKDAFDFSPSKNFFFVFI